MKKQTYLFSYLTSVMPVEEGPATMEVEAESKEQAIEIARSQFSSYAPVTQLKLLGVR